MKIDKLFIFIFFIAWLTYGISFFQMGHYYINLLIFSELLFTYLLFSRSPSLGILFFIIFYSTLVSAFINPGEKTISHFTQQILVLTMAFGVSRLYWKLDIEWFRKFFLVILIFTVIYAIYQYFARIYNWPWAYLPVTNDSYLGDEGFQRGYSRHMARASSFFIEPSDFGRFLLWGIAIGLSSKKRIEKTLFISVSMIGLMVCQSLGAFIGLVIMLTVYFIINFANLKKLFMTAFIFILFVISFF